jgi:hypothetical protein
VIIGFTINKGLFFEEAIIFLQKKYSNLVEGNRHSLTQLLEDSNYIYYRPINSYEISSSPFEIRPVEFNGCAYKNISDQKIEVPIYSLEGSVKYSVIPQSHFFTSTESEALEVFLSRKIVVKACFSYQEEIDVLLLQTGELLLTQDLVPINYG